MLASLRSPTSKAIVPNPSSFSHLPSRLFHTHFISLVQHVKNPPIFTPGPQHHTHGSHVPHVLSTRPFHKRLYSSNPHLPSHTGYHPPTHVSFPRWHGPPLAHQPHPRYSSPARPRRRRGCLSRLQPLRSLVSDSLRVGFGVARANVDSAEP